MTSDELYALKPQLEAEAAARKKAKGIDKMHLLRNYLRAQLGEIDRLLDSAPEGDWIGRISLTTRRESLLRDLEELAQAAGETGEPR